jgi:hypothetical protein
MTIDAGSGDFDQDVASTDLRYRPVWHLGEHIRASRGRRQLRLDSWTVLHTEAMPLRLDGDGRRGLAQRRDEFSERFLQSER